MPITIASNAVSDKCWRLFKINGVHDSAVLKTTNYSYFFKTLDIPNNGLGLTLNPNPAGATINIYTMKITGDKFNANQMINTNNKPYQLRLHYLGTDALTVNGNADLSLFIVAPYADVTVSGNSGYYGGIKAKSLSFTGNGSIHYDESGDITTLSDVQYKVRDVVGRYR
ncbi:MAG: hypothetical protein GYA55_08535 [SAR324 cluster bacterium]|uniref:DUF7305 domain-containing protein n=1 Tax=SAR324 cluster bacterium TaxID=2024889 RepID=A0A7X9FRZ6_9DELT|nr:hypothetical protein [SAR324 cluster bacterium]